MSGYREWIELVLIIVLMIGIVIEQMRLICGRRKYARALTNLEQDNFITEMGHSDIEIRFSKVTRKLLKWVYCILKASTQVQDQTKHIKQSCDASQKTSMELKEEFKRVGDKSDEATGYLEELHNLAGLTYKSHQNIQKLSNKASKYAKETGDYIESGSESVTQTVDILNEMNDNIENVDRVSDALMDKVRKVDRMAGAITNLAGEINMLSLNASIEAARAGDSGRGFAVVASQIRALAADSSEYASNIMRNIDEITRHTEAVSDAVNTLSDKRDVAHQSMTDITEYFGSINRDIGKIIKAVNEVNEKLEDGLRNSEQMDVSSENVAQFFVELKRELSDVNTKIAIQHDTETDNVECCNYMQETVQSMLSFTREFESLLSSKLAKHCKRVADMIYEKKCNIEDIQRYCEANGISEIYITDADGVTELSNNQDALGFRFSEDQTSQAYEFRTILDDSNRIVEQEFQKRDFDNKFYKFVATSKKNAKGIVQAGLDIDDILNLKML